MWKSSNIDFLVIPAASPVGPFKYKFALEREAAFTRYTGFYMEIVFESSRIIGGAQNFTVTTETNIIPEFDPRGDCRGEECLGTLA